MSLFVCDECNAIENTALAGWDGYHGRKTREHKRGEALCSQCNPSVGKWHGRWPRRAYVPEEDKDSVVNR